MTAVTTISPVPVETARAPLSDAQLLATYAEGLPVQLDVLHGSPADRFYQRHGFVKFDEDDIEANYERAVGGGPA